MSELPTHWLDRVAHTALIVAALALPLGEGIMEGAFMLAMAASAATLWRRSGWPGLRNIPRPVAWVLIGWAGWLLLGLVAAHFSGVAPRSSHLRKALYAPAMLVGWYLVAVAPAARRRRFWLALGVGTAIAGVAGLCQYFFGAFPGEQLFHDPPGVWQGQLYIPGTSERAASGLLRNRMKTAKVDLLSLSVIFAWAVTTLRPRQRLLSIPAFAAGSVLLALTFVEAAWAAVAAALGGCLLLWMVPALRRWVGVLWAAVATSGVACIIWYGAGLSPLGSLPSEDKLVVRRWIWTNSLELFSSHPYLGSGLGTFSRASLAVYPADESAAHTIDAHSQHLTALAEGGVVGFVFWALLLAGIALALQRAWRRRTPERALLYGVTFYLSAVLVASLVHDYLFHPQGSLTFWAAVGAALALAAESNQALSGTSIAQPRPLR